MPEIIYILTNEAMPDLIKIGMTDNLDRRVRELSRASGVPLPFEVYYACEVERMTDVEPALHDAFLDFRVNPKREFFKMNPERAVSILKLLEKRDVTPKSDIVDSQEEQQSLDKARDRRSVFNFKLVDSPVGAELVYVRDENVTVRVVDERRVEYNNEIFYLAPLSQKLLGYARSVQGALYWTYEGETLDERRRRLELGG